MNSLGRHVLVEFYDCDSEILNDVSSIETNMVAAAKEAGATVINSTFHYFSPFGVSGVVVIQVRVIAGVITLRRPAVHSSPGATGLLHLRVLATGGNAEQRLAFQDGEPGDAQGGIFPARNADQFIQGGIVEGLPPELQVLLVAGLRGQGLPVEIRLPLLQPADLGLCVIGAQVGAGLQRQRSNGYRQCAFR